MLGAAKQPVGVAGVGPLGPVQVELEALAGGDAGDLVDDLGRGLGAAELAGVGLGHRHRRPGRGPRVELVRPVDDLDVLVEVRVVGQPSLRLLEPALADVAPRADDVGPDLDEHVATLWPTGGPSDARPGGRTGVRRRIRPVP